MCGGGLGKLQNLRHNEQSLFGLLPDNNPVVQWESKVENYLSPNTVHGNDSMVKAAESKAKAEAAARESSAISEAKTLAEGSDASTKAMRDAYSDGVAQNAAADAQTKATQSKSLLASASDKEETNKLTSTKDTKTKTTLLGG